MKSLEISKCHNEKQEVATKFLHINVIIKVFFIILIILLISCFMFKTTIKELRGIKLNIA